MPCNTRALRMAGVESSKTTVVRRGLHTVPIEPTSPKPDRVWFEHRIAEMKLSQRRLAHAINLDSSSLNRSLKAKRTFKIEELVKLAEQLHVSRDEILVRLGYPRSEADVPIVGRIHADSGIEMLPSPLGVAEVPPGVPKDVRALVADTANSTLSSWDECVFYFAPAQGVSPDDVGRVCVIAAAGRNVLGALSRGSARGRYKVTTFGLRATFEPDEVTSASPVLWIRSP